MVGLDKESIMGWLQDAAIWGGGLIGGRYAGKIGAAVGGAYAYATPWAKAGWGAAVANHMPWGAGIGAGVGALGGLAFGNSGSTFTDMRRGAMWGAGLGLVGTGGYGASRFVRRKLAEGAPASVIPHLAANRASNTFSGLHGEGRRAWYEGAKAGANWARGW
jgi:hypothetical protein